MAHQLFHLPRPTAISSNLTLVAGAKVSFFLTGTSTPTNTYQDSGLTTPHTNPVVADAAGRLPAIYLNPAVVYRITFTDGSDVEIYPAIDPANDQILSQAIIGGLLYPRTAAEIAAAVTPAEYSTPNDSTGVVFSARYSSAADFEAVVDEATLGSVAAAGFATASPLAGSIARFYSREAITEHAHYGFLDDSSIIYAGGAPIYGHASFNDNVTFTGTVASDHHHSFQSYPHYDNSGTIARIAGFYSIGDVTDGTVTHYAGLHVDDPTGSATITNLYGVYVNELDRGTGNSYAFYSEGRTKSCLGGDLQLGVPATPAIVKYNYDTGHLELIPRADAGNAYNVFAKSEYLYIGDADVANTANLRSNASSGDLEITARTGFVTKMKSPTQVEHPLKVPAYTVAQLGSSVLPADWTDCICICSNESGGRVPVFSDGTNWLRCTDRAVIS